VDTSDFLNRVLPDSGLRVVVAIGAKGPRQTFYPTNEAAAAALIAADKRGANAYHGCATYKDDTSRKANNVEAAKALWVDLDCGDTKPYEDQAAAGRAAVLFTKTIGLPPPLIVNSGRGLHVYWLLENEVCAADWLAAATLLKLAAQHAGLEAGPERTADIASILRTPGTHHRKAEPLPVLTVRDGRPAPYDFILDRLQQYCEVHGLDALGAAPTHVSVATINADLEVKYNGPPPSIEPIVESCAIIREFRDSGGQIEEPLWRAAMGVVRHCVDGPELCHEWSSGHPSYSRQETDAKLAGLEGTGPTTCKVLGSFRPDACAACPLLGTCKSPISVGYKPIAVTEIIDPEAPDAEPIVLPDLPSGYTWTDKGLYGTDWVKSEDDPTKKVPVTSKMSDILFYPVAWVTDTNRDRSLQVRVHMTAGETEDFMLKCGSITEGGSKLLGLLGARMITCEKGKGPMVQHYLQEWMNVLRTKTQSITSYDRFGWYGKDFLIGTTLYKNDGTQQEVVLTGSALAQADSFIPKGDLKTWVATVDRAYNHPTLEPLQFAILAGLASPLLSLFDEYGGVTVFMHTQKSGIGKTTISRAALSCYSAWKDGQLTHTQFTTNALYATFGSMNALPLVLDEMTHIDSKDAAEMVHLISSGTAKRRCEKTGALQKSDQRWSLIAIASGNNLLTEKIGQYRSQAAAENARIFEYSIQGLLTPITTVEAATLFPKFSSNYGWAGREFVKYIVENYDGVKEALFKTHAALAPLMGLQQSERYWATLMACVLTTHKIATKLGLINFPRSELMKFMQGALMQNRDQMSLAAPQATDQIGRMISDLWPGVFITHGAGDAYAGWDCYIAKQANGPVTGRYTMRRPGAAGASDVPVIYLAADAVRKWAADRNISARDLMREAAGKGLIKPSEISVQLGRGSVMYSGLGTVKCWVVNESALPATMSPAAPQLTVIQGTKAKP